MSNENSNKSPIRRSVAHLSLYGTTQLYLRNPLVTAFWSVAFLGMGHKKENIMAIPMDKRNEKVSLFDSIHSSDGLSLLDLPFT